MLFDRSDPDHPKREVQKAGLDFNSGGQITKTEAAAKVGRRLELGLRPQNACD